eukprot:COSAG06_NODE_61440_length_267_cov_1.910714_1_plen_55_part_01
MSCYFDVISKISAGGVGDNQNLNPGFVEGAQFNSWRVFSPEEQAPSSGGVAPHFL